MRAIYINRSIDNHFLTEESKSRTQNLRNEIRDLNANGFGDM